MPLEGRFRFLTPGDVAKDAGEEGAVLRLPAGQRNLKREFGAVFSASGQLDLSADYVGLASGEVALDAVTVRLLEALRHQQCEWLAQRFRRRVAEHLFGGFVEVGDISLTVAGDNGVSSGFTHDAEFLLCCAQGLLRFLALGNVAVDPG